MAELLAGRLDYCPVPLHAADGRQPVETRVVAGHWNGVPALFGVSRDMTERLRIEQALESEAARRRILFEQSREGIALFRIDGSLIEHNPAFAEMLGYAPEEPICCTATPRTRASRSGWSGCPARPTTS